MKSRIFFSAVISFCLIIIGCSGGGGKLVIGSIEGPILVAEGSSMDFSIEASGDTGITYLWAVDPQSAGTFENQTSATTTFNAGLVESHTTITIQATVNSDHTGTELISVDIEIRDIGNLVVENIEGPESVDENSSDTFSINAYGDVGITYQWTCDPPTAGTFTFPNSRSTTFIPENVGVDTDIVIQVTVDSSNFEPVCKIHDIQINEVDILVVSEIIGPAKMDEIYYQEFSVDAYGDSGITYEWTCDPQSMGTFENPTEPTTIFISANVDGDTPVEINVTVVSDNYGPELRSIQVTLRDLPGYGSTLTWGGEWDDAGKEVAIDGLGNIYVTGYFQKTADFDPGPGVDEHTAMGENYWEIFLSKFDPLGNFLWARTWGGEYADLGNGIAVDDSGNVYVTGYFQETVDFDPDPIAVDEHISNGNEDCFLSKFDSSGNYQWARTWGGINFDQCFGIAIDGSGNAYATGYFKHDCDFDPGPGVDIHTSNGYSNIFLSKFDTTGNYQWVRTWGLSNHNEGTGVAISGLGNVFITGFFEDNCDMDPGSGVDIRSSNGGKDIFLIRLDSTGNYQWGRTWGGGADDKTRDIVMDGAGNIYVTGFFKYTVDFDPNPGVDEHTAIGNSDSFLSKLDSMGNYKWAQTWGGESSEGGLSVAVDSSENAYVTGEFHTTCDFDPGTELDEQHSNGYADCFLNKFDSIGNYRWVRTWGGQYHDYGYGVAVDGSGNVYVTGKFDMNVDFNPGVGVDMRSAILTGPDAFLIKFLPES